VSERIRFSDIQRGDLLRVIEHRTARQVLIHADRFVWNGIDTFSVSDGHQEVSAIIERIERVRSQEAVLCGRMQSVSGDQYPPCARQPGHPEAYCRDASGNVYFLAVDHSRPL
jgi:hypothetical protein